MIIYIAVAIVIVTLGLAIGYGISLPARRPRSTLKTFQKDLFKLIEKGEYDYFKVVFEEHNADPNLQNDMGDTLVLYSISAYKPVRFLEFLRRKGANLDARDKKGATPLFRAVFWDVKDAFLYLVKQSVDLNATNSVFGVEMNPLVACMFKNHFKMACVLLYYGADPFLADEIIQHPFYGPTRGYGFPELFDFYKRFNKGKKAVIYTKYLLEKGYVPKQKIFDVRLLDEKVMKRIICQYL